MKPPLVLFLLLCALFPARAANPKLDAALVKVVDFGNSAQIRKLVAQGADVNARNDIGQTVLERAAQYGNYETVKTLLELGANVNSVSPYGGPLVMAARDGYGNSPAAVCRLLLEHGANPNGGIRDVTPLIAALRDAVGAEAGASIHVPPSVSLSEPERDLLNRGFAQLEQRRVQRIHESGLQIVQFLIAGGADVNPALKGGTTPLRAAAKAGSVEAMKLLITSGARTDTPSLNAALEEAALSGSSPAVYFLLSRGASPNAGRAEHHPAITKAALANATESIKLLANAGADVNAKDVDGGTALNLVMLKPDVPAVKFLLAHGAKPNIPDKSGKTPLYWAKEMKNDELITLLRFAGAKK